MTSPPDGAGRFFHTARGADALADSLHADPPRRILIIIRSFIGDAVMTTGAVRSVIARFPEAHITLEGTSRSMAIFENVPGIHARRVRSDRFEKLTSVLWLRTSPRFDLAVLLDNSTRRAKVARWGGIRRVVGVREADDEQWLTASVLWDDGGHDLYDSLRGVLALLQAEIEIGPRIDADERSRLESARLFEAAGGSPTVGIFVDASVEPKRWPDERFLDLASRLEQSGVPVAILAGPGNERLLAPFRAAGLRTIQPGHPLVLAECVRRFRVMVTGDSAPAHIADAIGVPAVILYGATSPPRGAPYYGGHRLLHGGAHCEFYSGRCDARTAGVACDRRCMMALSVDQVFEATMALLHADGERRAIRSE